MENGESECPNSHWGHNMSAGRCLNCNVSAASPVRAQNPGREHVRVGHSITRMVKRPCPAVGGHCQFDSTKRCTACQRTMGELARLDAGMLSRLGDDVLGRGSRDPCTYNMERVRAEGSTPDDFLLQAVKMANLDVTHPKPFAHPRSLKGRVNVAALGVDDPCGDDVS